MNNKLTVMSYNIEHMKRMVYKGKIRDEDRTEAVAQTIEHVAPHLLGIVEATPKREDHELFVQNKFINQLKFKIGKSDHDRGQQDMVFYYRDPVELVELDPAVEFYDSWLEDIDDDGIKELCEFERIPLEGLFKVSDVEFMVILVMTKSKGVFSVNDLIMHQHLALANRKRQLAQAKKIRQRVDVLMDEYPERPIIVMGDFNDDPGMDSYERLLGSSSIETIMGSVYSPGRILHNALWHLKEKGTPVWTTEYPDLIVHNLKNHRGWLDHIFLSPNLLDEQAALHYVSESGEVFPKSKVTVRASDHLPIYCELRFN